MREKRCAAARWRGNRLEVAAPTAQRHLSLLRPELTGTRRVHTAVLLPNKRRVQQRLRQLLLLLPHDNSEVIVAPIHLGR